MEKFFKLKENGTNVSTEIMAGITTVSYTHLDVYKRQVVSNPSAAVDALTKAGLLCHLTEVVGVELMDEVGNLNLSLIHI